MEALVFWSGVALWLLGMTLLLRSPKFLGAGVLASLFALGGLCAFLGGDGRATTPLLLQALALGVFLPPSRPKRAPRVAQRKTPHKTPHKTLRKTPRKSSRAGWNLPKVPFKLPNLTAKLTLAAPTLATGSYEAPAAQASADHRADYDASSPFDLWDIPGYDVLEKVGSGGMASVFRAHRKRDGALVALKVPNEHFVGDEGFIRRFHQEAEVAQRFVHANIVRTFEHGTVGAKHFIVMEFVEGHSLENYIDAATARYDYAVSCELMRQAVCALSYIHGAGVVHRDIKPANMMLRQSGLAAEDADHQAADNNADDSEGGVAPDALKLMDFGVAGGQVSKLTVMGARVGTPTYMSPEQARGLRSDERSDVYSLGLVFYELLTGQSAFRGGYEVIVHQQIFQLPPPPRQLEPRIPLQLERLVMQMIAKEPGARPSLAEIEHRLLAPFELPELRSKSRLLCALGATQGSLRIFDTAGNIGASADLGTALPALPQACASDSRGNLYVAVADAAEPNPLPKHDPGAEPNPRSAKGHALIYKLAPDGVLLGSFGHYGMRPGEFLRPVALAAAPDDSVWVLDAETHRLEHFREDGLYLGGFGGPGVGEGRFNDPRDLLISAQGELFVLDYGNRQVQHFGSDGRYKNRWAFRASSKADEDPGTTTLAGSAELRLLNGFTLAQSGDLYLREAQSGEVHRISPLSGAIETLSLGQTETARPGVLLDLGVDDAGQLFLAVRGSSRIRKYTPSGELLATLETYAPISQLRVDVRA